jgi:SAM-dependent methyltransferase
MADALTSAGYGVLGIDASSAMIRLARARASRASFRVGTLRSAQIPACSAVIAIGEVVSYLTGNRAANERVHDAELAAFFARARRALRPCGLLVFDFIESAEGRTYAVKRMTGTDWAIRLRAAVNRSRGTLTRTIVTFRRDRAGYRQSQETHRLRIYPRADIRHLLAEAGFTTIFRRRIGTVRLMRGNVIAIAQQRARR